MTTQSVSFSKSLLQWLLTCFTTQRERKTRMKREEAPLLLEQWKSSSQFQSAHYPLQPINHPPAHSHNPPVIISKRYLHFPPNPARSSTTSSHHYGLGFNGRIVRCIHPALDPQLLHGGNLRLRLGNLDFATSGGGWTGVKTGALLTLQAWVKNQSFSCRAVTLGSRIVSKAVRAVSMWSLCHGSFSG